MKTAFTIQTAIPQKADAVALFVFEDSFNSTNLPITLPRDRFETFSFKGSLHQLVHVENIDQKEHVFVIGLGKKKDFSYRLYRDALAELSRRLQGYKIKNIIVSTPDFDNPFELGKQTALGILLGTYVFTRYKAKKADEKEIKLEHCALVAQKSNKQIQEGFDEGSVLAEGVSLTRDLVNDPASHTNEETLVEVAQGISKRSKQISVEVFDEKKCRALGMGAYLGVAQGSDRPPKFIVLHYKPLKKTSRTKRIALVGKSIIFDSGGLSLKPADSMMDMKIDMTGGGTVLGVFSILAGLRSEKAVEAEVFGVLPACENMPSGKAIRPGDIVTALNGKTIEVLNTDAEGRLTLADALVYAEKYLKADTIIDLATLTGACMVALGADLTGFFSNNNELKQTFEQAAEKEGDDLWSLPLYQPYLKKMKSDIADLKNIGGGRYGGAITAALFLSEFVDKAAWIHMDIAGPAYRTDEPSGILGKGATGWGVLSIISFLQTYGS